MYIIYTSICVLDYVMDGQLGLSGEEDSHDSLVPYLLSRFHELQPPNSSTDPSEAEEKASLKV